MNPTCDLVFEGENEGDYFGFVVNFGDIDSDGYEDIVIGAPLYGQNQGRAYLYWGGKRDSMDTNPDRILEGEAQEDAG